MRQATELLIQINFNESLTNDVVSFEQLGPDLPIAVTGKVGHDVIAVHTGDLTGTG